MRIQEHISLRELTTLKVGGAARFFCSVSSVQELHDAVLLARKKKLPLVVLGGGSNVLVAEGEIDAVVMRNEIRGVVWESPLIKGALRHHVGGGLLQSPAHRHASAPFVKGETTPVSEDGDTTFSKGDFVFVIAGAGENWDALVAEAVKRRLWGIENLSGIPGTVGAAPIQNIGAYGVEIGDVLEWVEVFDSNTNYEKDTKVRTGAVRKLSNTQCGFGYRDSVFKHEEGRGLIITRVALRLSKRGKPNLEYKDLKESFNFQFSIFNEKEKQAKITELTPTDIRRAVVEIRSRKFPDLATHGTAGSFFKNPIISQKQFDELKREYPDLPGFPLFYSPLSKGALPSSAGGMSNSFVKVPLAWILEHICRLKGYRKGNVALFERQPIVLVATSGATAEEIQKFSEEIAARVKEKTGIAVQWEVQRIS